MGLVHNDVTPSDGAVIDSRISMMKHEYGLDDKIGILWVMKCRLQNAELQTLSLYTISKYRLGVQFNRRL